MRWFKGGGRQHASQLIVTFRHRLFKHDFKIRFSNFLLFLIFRCSNVKTSDIKVTISMHSSSLSVSNDCDVFRGTVNTVDCDVSLCYLVFVAAMINSTVLLTMSEESPHEFNARPAY